MDDLICNVYVHIQLYFQVEVNVKAVCLIKVHYGIIFDVM